ncbi:MAG: hypothetical protein AB8B56_15430 [Crocinitomicaceae bacterium]
MKDRIFYSFLEIEQLDEDMWVEILNFAEDWNTSHDAKFIIKPEEEVIIQFDNLEDEEFKEVTILIEEKEGDWEWLFIHQKGGDPHKKGNIENSDFIQIIGDGYPDAFYLNQEELEEALEDCPVCGTSSIMVAKEDVYVKIDNDFKDFNNSSTFLDVVNAGFGRILVSNKFKEAIKDFDGITYLPVLNKDDSVSDVLFQLKFIHMIHKSKSLAEPDSICNHCGAFILQNAAPFTISKSEINEFSVFSRDVSGLSKFHLSKSLYEKLKVAPLKRIVPIAGVMLKD